MTPKLLDDLSQETKKGLHKLRVINYLLRNKTATMTDIAKELYVSGPTASKILQDLQDGGCIQSQGKLEIGVGRFPLLFGLNPDGGYFIGVDIKRSGMHIGLINLQSELICADYDLPYTLENTPEALEAICREIRGFITRHGIQPKEILNINVNLPGRINPVTGHSYSLFNFFGDRPLSEILSSKLALRVSIDNDTRGMAFGEFTAGCTKDMEVNSVLYVNISWGLGLGIIQDKQIYFGKSGFSGEFGHISVFDNQILCHCGKKGCLETEVSGQAMCRKIQERIRAGESSVLSSIVHSGRELGKQVANLINVFNPELVIIGGSLADASGYLTQQVEASVRIYSMSVVTRDTQIRTATLGDRAGLIGACMLARSRRFAEPSK